MYPGNTWRLFIILLLSVMAPSAMASDGVIHFSGAVTVPTCPITLPPVAIDQQAAPRVATEGDGCEGTGKVGAFSVEAVGAPQEGYAVVILEVY